MPRKYEQQGKHAAIPRADSSADQTRAFRPNEQSRPVYGRVQPVELNDDAFQSAASEEYTRVHRRRTRRVILIVLAVLAIVYLAGVTVFSNVFYPNTRMGSRDISLQPPSSVAQTAQDLGANYSVQVTGQGLNFRLSSQDLGVNVDGDAVARDALHMYSAWEWPVQVFLSHDVSESLSNGINANGVKQAVDAQVNAFNQNATDPVDATIAYSKQVSAFVVEPEQAGTKLDGNAVLSVVDQAVADMQQTATITSAQLVQPSVLSTDSQLKNAADQASKLVKADIKLTMGPSNVNVAEITPSDVSGWVVLDSGMNPSISDDAITQWVTNFANSVNTVGTTRTYTRPDGQQFTVSGGTYGWEVDNDALASQVKDAISQGSNTTIDVPTISAAYTYAGQGKQDFGRYIDVDLTKQHAIAYDESGNKIWESDIVTGKPDEEHATPEGVWVLFNKESPSVLKGKNNPDTGKPEYETKVQYWMAFTDFGDGFHDATWQSAFGGTRYRDGYGSHGCINLPLDAAGALYNVINTGNAVVIHS